MKFLPALLSILAFPWLLQTASAADSGHAVLARYLIAVADDFIVNVYLNGELVPDDRRKMIGETYGAMSEQINIEAQKGDWIVFNVVNDRFRWGGARYFAVAGMLGPNKVGFYSSPSGSQRWTFCDDASQVKDFISSAVTLDEEAARKIEHPWGDGEKLIKQFVGSSWRGFPIWGKASNTWIKVALQ